MDQTSEGVEMSSDEAERVRTVREGMEENGFTMMAEEREARQGADRASKSSKSSKWGDWPMPSLLTIWRASSMSPLVQSAVPRPRANHRAHSPETSPIIIAS
jgi:hypothetical protein